MDLVQHLVEGPDQEADLVAAFRRGPHRVVLLRRYGARRVGQPNDGPGDGLRHEPRDAEREHERTPEDGEDDAGVAALAAVDFRQVRLDDEGADRPPLEPDGLGHEQVVGGEDRAGGDVRGKREPRAGWPVAEVGRERPRVASHARDHLVGGFWGVVRGVAVRSEPLPEK